MVASPKNPIIRTITLGLTDTHPLTAKHIQQAGALLREVEARLTETGYELQTLRLSTRSLWDDLAHWSATEIQQYTQELQELLDEQELTYCSLGAAQVTRPDFPLERLDILADLLLPAPALSATVQLATLKHGLRAQAALPTAHIIKRLANESEEGFGNFRFAMLACVEPGSPFFPAAYHEGASSLSVGLQGVSIVAETLQQLRAQQAGPLDLTLVSESLKAVLQAQAGPVVKAVKQLAETYEVRFGGIDLSPAPMGEESIAAAMELCGYGPLGSPGTLAVAAALTAALKGTDLPTCGYNGLMLPVLEDRVLGQRWAERHVNAHQLLLYSTVCGTGLDTVPLPGDCSAEEIAALLLDVATLALRLRKPLSARLFPVPGRQAGERTTFSSPYLTNTLV